MRWQDVPLNALFPSCTHFSKEGVAVVLRWLPCIAGQSSYNGIFDYIRIPVPEIENRKYNNNRNYIFRSIILKACTTTEKYSQNIKCNTNLKLHPHSFTVLTPFLFLSLNEPIGNYCANVWKPVILDCWHNIRSQSFIYKFENLVKIPPTSHIRSHIIEQISIVWKIFFCYCFKPYN